MIIGEEDPDVVRWGLNLLDVCSLSNSGSVGSVTHYDWDLSQVNYVKQGYCHSAFLNAENNDMAAQNFHEEPSHFPHAEAQGGHRQESFPAQNWDCHYQNPYNNNSVYQINQEDAEEAGSVNICPDPEENAPNTLPEQNSPVIDDESILDGEVGKRLNQMFPVPHVPKTNGEIPSMDEASSDHQRLLERLELYDLVELKVSGDGNCQFRSLSDQIYRTIEHHKFVRQQIIQQLKSYPELYEGYVPMPYDEYIKRMSKNGEWGDHVTMQAAADSYGLQIFVITSFKDTCYIEILPREQKSKRIITLSFWAEVHYNSIYPRGEFPVFEPQKKKKWWWPVI